jgi:hypothetical protein
MITKQGDYVIVKLYGKYKLVLVTTIAGEEVSGFLEDELARDEHQNAIKFPLTDIVANFGKNPEPGRAYGVIVEPFQRSVKSGRWGTISFYRHMTAKDIKVLRGSLVRTFDVMHDRLLTGFAPLSLEIRPPAGKYAGWYKRISKFDQPDVLCLKPRIFDGLTNEEIDRLVYHESAHGIWWRLIPKAMHLKWLGVFHKRMVLRNVDNDTLQSIRKSIQESGLSLSSYLKHEATDDTEIIIREVVKYVKRIHRLEPIDIDLILEHGKSLKKLWPTHSDLSSPYIDVSEYAATNARELFAESFAFFMTGIKLPPDLDKLMNMTLNDIKMRGGERIVEAQENEERPHDHDYNYE